MNIEELLSKEYDIKIKSITEAPRGFIAETHIVNIENDKYFLKILKDNRYSKNILQSLPILSELKKLDIDFVNYPIKTIDNNLYLKEGERYLVLFNYIEGSTTWDYDVIEVYKKLIKIHKLSKKIISEVNEEDFVIRYEKEFEISLERYKELKILKNYIDDINKHWIRFNSLSKKLSKKTFKLYLTHGDTFCNILAGEGRIYIVDWDDLILGPLERDLWFYINNEKVVELYKSSFKGFKVDQELINYYIYNRFFDDLLGFFEELDKDTNGDKRREILGDIEKDCIHWTYKLIKDFSS